MFAKAYEIASQYTQPVLVSYRFYDQSVESGLGSFVIINDEGWIITAAHILDPMITVQQHAHEMQAFQQRQTGGNNYNTTYTNGLTPNTKWMLRSSHWWGADNHVIKNFLVLKENDIAIGKIENFDPNFCKQYPVFKDPNDLKIGTSLCKLGYPFYEVRATFNEANNAFQFDPSIFPIPRFPIEGMFTRNIRTGKSADNKFDIQFIETSSPGLRGQSGGPIFDVYGAIYAIQSQTRHLPLGFSPKIIKDGKEIEENQFLNVGWGAHVETILAFLDAHNISYKKT